MNAHKSNIDVKLLFGSMVKAPYLSPIEHMPLVVSKNLLGFNELFKRHSVKMSGNIGVLFCAYSLDGIDDVVKRVGRHGKVLFLPPLSGGTRKSVLQSYFYGYEGMTGELFDQVRDMPKVTKAEKFVYSKQFIRLFEKYYLIFRNIIKEHNVKAVFLTGLVGLYESALLQLSLDLGIKIFCCQHGFYRNLYPNKKLLKNVIFFASGNEEKRTLLRCGINPKNIFVTGSPFFDKIAKYRKHASKSHGKKTITILTQPLIEDSYIGESEYFDYVRKFLSETASARNVDRIIIKLHPRETHVKQYMSIAESIKSKNIKIATGGDKNDLYKSLSSSTLLLSYGSTTDVEGIALGKDIILINGLKRGNMGVMQRKDGYRTAVIEIDKDDCLSDCIDHFMNNPQLKRRMMQHRDKYLNENFFAFDGTASARVTNIIERLLSSKMSI
jgi:hypothetical protein